LCKAFDEAGKNVKKVGYVYRALENEEQGRPQDLRRKNLQAMAHDLRSKQRLVQLQVEIEPKLQAKSVPAEEQALWLSDMRQLKDWVPSTGRSLQHIRIIDYGQQAIMNQSSILEIFSRHYEFSISYVVSVLVLLRKCFSSCIARKCKLHSQLFATPPCVHSKS
jgi:hypothetical protein